ncbi:hypothetical protein O3M35_004359 [Rhynocoris fuscipes]|uniref:beta-N-acetylhexosaminidase n=1 Tax=Rhynocoris fuscipes TaxID=488301 RepID=A0AAW1CI24_9HEMI
MKMAGGCSLAAWVTLAFWRRKSILLLITVLLVLVIGVYRYSNIAAIIVDDHDTVIRSLSAQDKRMLLGGSSVQFVAGPSLAQFTQLPNIRPQAHHNAPDKYLSKQGNEVLLSGVMVAGPAAGIHSTQTVKSYIPKSRLVHIDLKGAPPTVAYLKKIFALAKDTGATGVLIEWEDMFPWSGELASLAARNAYTLRDVKEIIMEASNLQLDVIPLVQTFGHVEFALKNEDFYNLREVPDSAQALCPSLNASMHFIQRLIEQVMEVHEDSKYLHIGCDEVFQMGECSRCRSQPRENLFLWHVSRVAQFVRSRYPKVTPIIWDDMLRHLPPPTLDQYRIGDLVEPMVWVYAEDVYRFVPYSVWDKYASVFPRIWAASAYKGAFGETLYIPNVKRHLDNNLHWLELMASEGPKFKGGFQGIVLTGWQRYDHFSVLCELLPAAIPSLVITLTATAYGYMNSSLRNIINNRLSCGVFGPVTHFNLNNDPYLWDSYSRCTFPGHAFFKLTYRLNGIEKEADELINSVRKQKGWMTDYNVRHNFSTPLRIDELMQDEQRVYHTITGLVRAANDALSSIFDSYTIAEWVEQRIYPYIVELESLQKDATALKGRKIWSRRPFPALKDLARLGLKIPDEANETLPPG